MDLPSVLLMWYPLYTLAPLLLVDSSFNACGYVKPEVVSLTEMANGAAGSLQSSSPFSTEISKVLNPSETELMLKLPKLLVTNALLVNLPITTLDDTEFNFNGEGRRVVPGYYTKVVTDLAIDWMRSHRQASEQPFLLMLGQKAPHSFYFPEDKYQHVFDDVEVNYPQSASTAPKVSPSFRCCCAQPSLWQLNASGACV